MLILSLPQLGAQLGQLTKSVFKIPNASRESRSIFSNLSYQLKNRRNLSCFKRIPTYSDRGIWYAPVTRQLWWLCTFSSLGIAGEAQVKFLNGPKHIHRVGAPLGSARAFFEVLSLSSLLINILLILRVPQHGWGSSQIVFWSCLTPSQTWDIFRMC